MAAMRAHLLESGQCPSLPHFLHEDLRLLQSDTRCPVPQLAGLVRAALPTHGVVLFPVASVPFFFKAQDFSSSLGRWL